MDATISSTEGAMPGDLATRLLLERIMFSGENRAQLEMSDGQVLEIDLSSLASALQVQSENGVVPVVVQVSVPVDERNEQQNNATSGFSTTNNTDISSSNCPELSDILPSVSILPQSELPTSPSAVDSSTSDQVSSTLRTEECFDPYIDVVTTYRCRFCSFTCQWKSGLISHFRNCHQYQYAAQQTQETQAQQRLADMRQHPKTPTKSSEQPSSSSSHVTITPPRIYNPSACISYKSILNKNVNSKSATTSLAQKTIETSPLKHDTAHSRLPQLIQITPPKLPKILMSDLAPLCDSDTLDRGNMKTVQPKQLFSSVTPPPSEDRTSFDASSPLRIDLSPLPTQPVITTEASAPSQASNVESSHSNTQPPKRSASSAKTSKKTPKRQLSMPDEPVENEKHVFICGECNDQFDSLASCQEHMIVQHKAYPRAEFIEPEEESNGDEVRLDTSTQSEKDDSPKTQDVPDIQQEADRSVFCWRPDCSIKFISTESRDFHVKCHLSKGFRCPLCEMVTSKNWRTLSMHLWRVHKKDIDLYSCDMCDYKVANRYIMQNHKRIHLPSRDFVCAQCGKAFKTLAQLRHHHVTHAERRAMAKQQRWYTEQKCKICQRSFADTKCLKNHMKAVHNKMKPFQCPHCKHQSARKAMLQLHMRQHTGEKPFACDMCEYRTCDHNSLRRHKMVHTGMKPYQCPHCTYACIQTISLKVHMRNKHPGMSGVYECSLCSYLTVSRDNYLLHYSEHVRKKEVPAAGKSLLKKNNRPQTDPQQSPQDAVSEEQRRTESDAAASSLDVPENVLPDLDSSLMIPGNVGDCVVSSSSSSRDLTVLTLTGAGPPMNVNLASTLSEDLPSVNPSPITFELPQNMVDSLPSADNQSRFLLTVQVKDSMTAGSESNSLMMDSQNGVLGGPVYLLDDILGDTLSSL